MLIPSRPFFEGAGPLRGSCRLWQGASSGRAHASVAGRRGRPRAFRERRGRGAARETWSTFVVQLKPPGSRRAHIWSRVNCHGLIAMPLLVRHPCRRRAPSRGACTVESQLGSRRGASCALQPCRMARGQRLPARRRPRGRGRGARRSPHSAERVPVSGRPSAAELADDPAEHRGDRGQPRGGSEVAGLSRPVLEGSKVLRLVPSIVEITTIALPTVGIRVRSLAHERWQVRTLGFGSRAPIRPHQFPRLPQCAGTSLDAHSPEPALLPPSAR
jgi:hypothetical protein